MAFCIPTVVSTESSQVFNKMKGGQNLLEISAAQRLTKAFRMTPPDALLFHSISCLQSVSKFSRFLTFKVKNPGCYAKSLRCGAKVCAES
jgi:hypothetical protein